jgi:hypothetical protein
MNQGVIWMHEDERKFKKNVFKGHDGFWGVTGAQCRQLGHHSKMA